MFKGLESEKLRRWVVLGLFAVLGLLVVNWVISPSAIPTPPAGATRVVQTASAPSSSGPLLSYAAQLEARVSQALSRIQGAGQVTVTVSLAQGPTELLAQNQTTHTQGTQSIGSTGRTTQTTTDKSVSDQVVLGGGGMGGGGPIVTGEVGPRISGALVVAPGAANPIVADELLQAARVLLGTPSYTITVLKGGIGK